MILRQTRNRVVAASLSLAGVMLGAGLVVPALRSTAIVAPDAGGDVDQQALKTALDKLLALDPPGALVRVRRGDRTVTVVSGKGSTATGAAPGVDDRFRAASQTKTFVATVVLQLVAEGRISLDDRLDKYLPGVVPNAKAVTVRQLLNHTSGIYDYLNDAIEEADEEADVPALAPYFGRGEWTHQWTEAQLADLVAEKPLWFNPGTKFRYGNINYVLAGMIVRKITGTSIADEVTNRIITPLKLTNTSFPTTDATIAGKHMNGYLINMPDGHRWPTGTDVTTFSPTIFWGGAAMISNAADLETFYRALMAGQLLKPAQQQELRTVVPEDLGEDGTGLDQPPKPSAPATPSTTTVTSAKPSTTATVGRLGALGADESQDTQDTTGADDTPAPDDTTDRTAAGDQRTPAGDGPSTSVAPSTAPTTSTPPPTTVPSTTVPATTVPGTSGSDLPEGYGLGIEHARLSCGMAWGHSGSAFGYASQTLVSEDGTRDVEFVTNGNSRPPDGFFDQIGEVLDIALCSTATASAPGTVPNSTTTPSQVPSTSPGATGAAGATSTTVPGAAAPGPPDLTNRSAQTDPPTTDPDEVTDRSAPGDSPGSTDPAEPTEPPEADGSR